MSNNRGTRARRCAVPSTICMVVIAFHQDPLAAQDDAPPADVRAVIEGTWELIEWHVGDVVLRPPEMEGRWMVHDGLVMATRHRNGPDDFESTAGYGEYRWGALTWTYGYERSEDLRGPSPDEATLAVTGSNPIRMRTFRISRQDDMLVLDGETVRWEYDGPGRTFVLKTAGGGRTIRKYAKVRSPESRDPAADLASPFPDPVVADLDTRLSNPIRFLYLNRTDDLGRLGDRETIFDQSVHRGDRRVPHLD